MQKVASVLPRLLRGIGRRRTANFFETVEGLGFPLDLLAVHISDGSKSQIPNGNRRQAQATGASRIRFRGRRPRRRTAKSGTGMIKIMPALGTLNITVLPTARLIRAFFLSRRRYRRIVPSSGSCAVRHAIEVRAICICPRRSAPLCNFVTRCSGTP